MGVSPSLVPRDGGQPHASAGRELADAFNQMAEI
jgi:hypothetical protein